MATLIKPVEVYGGVSVPRASLKYKRYVIKEARYLYGMNAPIAMFAAQLHQESSWRPKSYSKYAKGLAQFTPSTADWIVEKFPELTQADRDNPWWNIRAMMKYDRWLFKRLPSDRSCDKWGFTLSAYNGGLTWVWRDKRLTKREGGDPHSWQAVREHSNRAEWAFKENRDYTRKILYSLQPIYKNWGTKLICVPSD